MAIVRLAVWSAAFVAATISASHAGPCAADIDAMQGRIDAKLEAIAAAGPPMREGGFAGMSDQPTPRSMAQAEVRHGELSAHTVARAKKAMARARSADAAGDKKACELALMRVRRAIGK